MFFTQEDYRKIEKWLLANSIKDTEFVGAATPLEGNETVVLVQNGKNVKASVKDVVEQLFLLGVSDFVNITDKYGESYISLSQAIELIPYRSRKVGQVITFLDETGKWSMYQFQGLRKNQWNTLSLWVDLIDPMKGMTVVDSEDIVTEVNSANQTSLKFADKTYNEADYSGLGRIYLRKNVINVEDPVTGNIVKMNYLTQSMISKENTIYIIQYDYSLNGQTIIIPDNCVLKFEGGSLKNGILDGNFTISSNKYNILIDIIAKGILNEEIPIEWFGGKAYSYWEDVQNGVDSNSALENAIQSNGSRIITFNEGYYKITKTINLPPYITIKGNAVNSKYYNIRRTSTPNVPLSSKIYFNSEDEVLFNINNNYISIEDISLHGTRSSDAIHLIDSGYSIKLKNVQIYVWRYGIYRIWDHILRTGFSGSIIDNCSFTELTGGIFIDYDESNAGSELYFITSNDIRNTTFTVCKAFGVYYKSNYSISNNIFKACTFSKIGYGNYELDLYNTFGCYAIKIESFQKSTINGGNKVESCYFEDIIPYRTGSIVTGETALSNGYIIPTDDTKYSTGIFYNCNIELDTTYYTNILKFFRIDNNTSISIGNARIYSFNTIFNNNVWKYTRLIYHEHSNTVPNYLNQSIVYNNNWRIAATSPLTGLVSYTLYNDRFNALVINQSEDRFTDYPPYVIESASNILSTRQVTGNTIQIDCVCTTSSIESTYIEGYIVYQEKYCKFSIVVDNINASAKFYAVEDSGYQGYGINVKYKKKSDTSFSLYISKTGIKYTIIPIRTSIVSQFKLTAINSSNIPEDSLDVIKLLKVNAISNLPTLNKNFVGYQTYDPNMKLPLFWNGLEWANSDGSLTSKVNTVFTTSQIIYPSRVYKIVSDIDLAGETLTIPINCTLDFQGGSFSNGTIVGSNTKIEAGLNKIFETIEISGTWNINEVYPEWFGAKNDGTTDSTTAFNKILKFNSKVVLSKGTYVVNGWDIDTSVIIFGNGYRNTIIDLKNSIEIHNNNNVSFQGFTIQINDSVTSLDYMIKVHSAFHFTANLCTFYGKSKVSKGIYSYGIVNSYYHTITTCRFVEFTDAILLSYNSNGCTIFNNEFYQCDNCIVIDSCNGDRIENNTFQSYKSKAIVLQYNNYGSKTWGNIISGNYFEGEPTTAVADIDFTNNANCRNNTIIGNKSTYIALPHKHILDCISENTIIESTNATYRYPTKLPGFVKLQNFDEASMTAFATSDFTGVIAPRILKTGAIDLRVYVKNADGTYTWKSIILSSNSNGNQINIGVLNATEITQYSGGYVQLGYDATIGAKRLTIDNATGRIKYSSDGKNWSYLQEVSTGNTANRPVTTKVGFMYFDTQLSKYICWNGTAWVNLDGTSLT